MSYPNVPQTSLPRVRTTFADWGLAYKVALGDIAFGVFMIVWSPFVGGVFYRGLTQLFPRANLKRARSCWRYWAPTFLRPASASSAYASCSNCWDWPASRH